MEYSGVQLLFGNFIFVSLFFLAFIKIANPLKVNRKESSHSLSLQVKNALMQKEMFGWAYDFKKNKVVEHGLTMVYPYISYKIEF